VATTTPDVSTETSAPPPETGRLQKVQFDEETGEWEPIGGPRSPTGRERGLTLAQESLNEERDVMRDEVRSVLDELPPGVSLMDEAVRRSKKESATGRENPDYDGGELLKSVRAARRRKYGDDPEHEKFVASLNEKRRPPEQAGAGQPQPAAQSPAGDQGGGFTDWVRRQFTGSETAPKPMPASKDQLEDGALYETPRGRAKWSARDGLFMPAQ
jgi:hypothetical protein